MSRRIRTILALALPVLAIPVLVIPVLLLSALAGCSSTLAPREDLPPGIRQSYAVDDLALVLRRYVDDAGRVDYAGLVDDGDALDRYYVRLSAISPDTHPDRFPTGHERLAYWINAYNACVLALVKDEYPISGVRDVRKPWYLFFLPRGSGFFYYRKVVLGGEKISLYALENDVVRKRFSEPRIHFALNCASISCPQLPRQPFLADDLDEQLERETRRFLAEARNLTIDHERQTVIFSAILDWYASDFTDWLAANDPEAPSTVREYVARHVDAETAAELRGRAATYAVEFADYDWGLNDAVRTAAD